MTTISVQVCDGTVLPAYIARPAPAAHTAHTAHTAIAPEFYHRSAPPGRWLPADDEGRAEGFGHLAFLAACSLPIDRAGVLYGGWLTASDIPLSRPTPTLDLAPGISGRLLYLVGEDDFLITAGQREQIADALKALGPGHQLVSYPGVGHAFWWPGTPAYDLRARQDAWGRILALLAG